METSDSNQPGIFASAFQFWRDIAVRRGYIQASRELLVTLWEFARDSTPARLRQRFGDADYDWDYRVNTTSGAVGWRDRLLGALHTLYQPTEPSLFHEMLAALREHTKSDLADFTFIDLGSGKGRTLLMASDYPFRRIIGVELLPRLHQVALQNISQYRADSQKCFAMESVCADASTFPLPGGPLVIYLFNPLLESPLRHTFANVAASLRQNPRPIYVLYHNPQLERIFDEMGELRKISGTYQYSLFAATH